MEFNNSSNKENSLYHDAIYWLTGSRLSSTAVLPIEDFTGNANYALDAFVRKYFEASGRWQYDDSNHVDGDGNPTLPIGTTDLDFDQDQHHHRRRASPYLARAHHR